MQKDIKEISSDCPNLGGGWATALVGPKSLGHNLFWTAPLKGILPQTIFYRPNLIFWIVMGRGKARFGRNGKKT